MRADARSHSFEIVGEAALGRLDRYRRFAIHVLQPFMAPRDISEAASSSDMMK